MRTHMKSLTLQYIFSSVLSNTAQRQSCLATILIRFIAGHSCCSIREDYTANTKLIDGSDTSLTGLGHSMNEPYGVLVSAFHSDHIEIGTFDFVQGIFFQCILYGMYLGM